MAEQFKIEKGVPMPLVRRGPFPKYPWREMEVGDSFFVSQPPKCMAELARTTGRRAGKQFTSRKENGGVRVWRVE